MPLLRMSKKKKNGGETLIHAALRMSNHDLPKSL